MIAGKMRIEWNEDKKQSNEKKHRVNFEIASQVFLDPFQVSAQDRVVDGEDRWQTFGMVGETLLLMVAHTVTESSDGDLVIRIIPSRVATPAERRRYEDEND